MAVNKVIYGGNTVIDLTGDTVTPETLAEGAIAHDKSGAVIHGTMAVVKRTPYFYDDADGRWVDNSEGMISPDYPDMTCPKCGAWLQSYMVINENPIDTFCPVCNTPITLIDGSVNERENIGSGVAYYFDVLDQMWMNNSDGVWGIPDYPSMSCPHCGVKLQASYEIDGNPQDTECPNCGGAIRLLDGQVIDRGENSGAQIKVVTGVFSQASAPDLYNNPVTVSGLGFKPKYVFVQLNHVTSHSSSHYENGKYHLLSIEKHEDGTKQGLWWRWWSTASSRGAPTKMAGSEYDITFNDDGFTITAGAATHYIAKVQYTYTAIG